MPSPNPVSPKEQAQLLLNHLAPDQIEAVVHLMEAMLDPLSRKLADAPLEDEEITKQEEQAVREARAWTKHNEPISDFERLGHTPLSESTRHRRMAKRIGWTERAKSDARAIDAAGTTAPSRRLPSQVLRPRRLD